MSTSDAPPRALPLAGVRVIELAGLAPVPHCGLILADFGATVIRVDRVGARASPDWLGRGKRSVALDLKSATGRRLLARLCASADVLLDPYRPGALEALGLAPDDLRKRNRRLIVARLTGYGQQGPYARMAGHDLNYLALSGVLSALGPASSPPSAPGNLLADFAGGALTCALGIAMALLERARTGEGQVIDAAMMDGALYLASFVWHAKSTPLWSQPRGENVLDGGAPWYSVYATRDAQHLSVAALEPHFYALLLEKLGGDLSARFLARQYDRECWAEMRAAFASTIAAAPLSHWQRVFLGSDACAAPVLPLDAAALTAHPQHARRGVLGADGAPLPAPRLLGGAFAAQQQRSASECACPLEGEHSAQVLSEAGISHDEIDAALRERATEQRTRAKL